MTKFNKKEKSLKAIVIKNPGKNSYLQWDDVPMVKPGSKEVVIRVHATAVNRADLLQRRGLYPPPAGASDIVGLECAGEIVETVTDTSQHRVGDRVCALLTGGGYSEYVNVHEDMVFSVPQSMTYEQAAAIPEAFVTAYLNLFDIGQLKNDEACLIHSGGSGVGTAAIQLAKYVKAMVITTAGSNEKIELCKTLGADFAFNYHEVLFAEKIEQQLPIGKGLDLILDTVGANYLSDNINLLGYRGRMIVIGHLSGSKAQLNLDHVLKKNIMIRGSTLRHLPIDDKIILIQNVRSKVMPLFEKGIIKPIVDSVFSIKQVEAAHRRIIDNKNFGKIVISMG